MWKVPDGKADFEAFEKLSAQKVLRAIGIRPPHRSFLYLSERKELKIRLSLVAKLFIMYGEETGLFTHPFLLNKEIDLMESVLEMKVGAL